MVGAGHDSTTCHSIFVRYQLVCASKCDLKKKPSGHSKHWEERVRVARQFGKMATEPETTFGDGAGYFLLRVANTYIFEETLGLIPAVLVATKTGRDVGTIPSHDGNNKIRYI